MGPAAGLMLAVALAPHSRAADRPIRYVSFQDGYVYYHAVVADMPSRKVTAEAYYVDKLTNASKMIDDGRPAAAITGTFFGWETQQPIADVVVHGRLVAQGNRGSAIGVDWYGQVKIFDTPWQREIDWYGYRHLLRGTVRLIRNGKVSPDPRAQHFTDIGLSGKAPRTGVGLTASGELVMMATNNRVTLSEFGNAMKRLEVVNAVALDGGGSTMLYYRGKLVIPPKRALSTIFILHERPLDKPKG